MAQGPLVNEQIEAGQSFLQEYARHVPVASGCWLKESDSGRVRLYVATDHVSAGNLRDAYGDVLRIARSLRNPNLDPFEIELISTDSPICQGAREIYKYASPNIPAHFTVRYFGGMNVDEGYVYPPSVLAPSESASTTTQ